MFYYILSATPVLVELNVEVGQLLDINEREMVGKAVQCSSFLPHTVFVKRV